MRHGNGGLRLHTGPHREERRSEARRWLCKNIVVGVHSFLEDFVLAASETGDRPDRQRPGQRSAALPALMLVSGLR